VEGNRRGKQISPAWSVEGIRRGKQIGPAWSVEGKIKSKNVAQRGQMKEKKILSFNVTV
jgi:hypothetical protein